MGVRNTLRLLRDRLILWSMKEGGPILGSVLPVTMSGAKGRAGAHGLGAAHWPKGHQLHEDEVQCAAGEARYSTGAI